MTKKQLEDLAIDYWLANTEHFEWKDENGIGWCTAYIVNEAFLAGAEAMKKQLEKIS